MISQLQWTGAWPFVLPIALVAAGLAVRSAIGAASALPRCIVLIRLVPLAALGVAAAGPGLWQARPEPARPSLALVVDTSRSMQHRDARDEQEGCSRLEAALNDWLAPAALTALSRTARLSFVSFADRAAPFDPADAPALRPVGSRTSLAAGLDAALDQPGITDLLLISDGRDTSADIGPGPDAASLARRARAAGVRIHVAPVGDDAAAPDISVSLRAEPDFTSADEPARLIASLHARGYSRIALPLTLERLDPDGPVEIARADAVDAEHTFQVLPVARPAPGEVRTEVYRVRAAAPPGSSDSAAAAAHALLRVTAPRMRTLMLVAAPSWDSRAAIEALAGEPDCTTIVVHALGSARAAALAPRFRTTRLVPVGPPPASRVDEPAPPAPTELAHADLVVLSPGAGALLDELAVDPSSLAAPRLLLPGAPASSVELPPGTAVVRASDGALIARLDEPALVETLPDDAAAAPLAFAETPWGDRLPAVVEQLGSSARETRLLIADLWRQPRDARAALLIWADRAAASGAQTPPGLTAWLTADPAIAAPDQPVSLTLVEHAASAPDLAPRAVTHTPPRGAPRQITLEPPTLGARAFTAILRAAEPGVHRLHATLTDPDNSSRLVETAFIIAPRDPEAFNTSAHPALLHALADATGGRVLTPGSALQFAQTLAREHIAARGAPQFHSPLLRPELFALIVAPLLLEWTLRRRFVGT
ncbi:MAG: vWA domain-containing protein [Planctomycetota bacterium]|nr:vWA domain-containing protein [Planctomycetota bacterium]